MLDVEVRRDDLRAVRVVECPDPEPGDGEVLLAVERFGFTANNITYAVLGDMLRYWEFFPREEGWGQIPVWGLGEVVASNAAELETGARLFGYFPMSTHMTLTPARVRETGVADATAHRTSLPPAYNAYRFIPPSALDDYLVVLMPLFFLGFLLDDALEADGDHGATTAIVSSASSKTAIATAFQLAKRGVEVVGLTSARNAEFVSGLEPYARVVTYDDVEQLERAPSMYLDIAGDASLRRRVHEHLTDALRHSAFIGATHWDAMQGGADDADLPGPAPAMFFAPDRLTQRTEDWGRAGLDERTGAAFAEFAEWCGGWLRIDRASGSEAATAAYHDVLEGRVAPDAAHVLNL